MKFYLNELINGRITAIEIDETTDGEKDEGLLKYLPENMKIMKNGIRLIGRITDNGKYYALRTEVSVRYIMPCDKCLDETEYELDFDFEKILSLEIPESYRAAIEDENSDAVPEEYDDFIFVRLGVADVTKSLSEAIATELPFVHLCSPDCRGLCPICGKKITDDEPECIPKKEIDPRLKIFEKLLDNSDEM